MTKEIERINFVEIDKLGNYVIRITGGTAEEKERRTMTMTTALTQCEQVNPSNPLAVARTIGEAFAICKYLEEYGCSAQVYEKAREVLARAQEVKQ